MRQIAFYGKGGIGKSTTGSNIAAALAEHGLSASSLMDVPEPPCAKTFQQIVKIQNHNKN